MDKRDVIDKALEYAKAINSAYGSSKIILFGSYAKGLGTTDSDIDIAVVLKDFDNKMSVQLDLMRLRRKIDSRIEPHPFRESEFTIANPLVSEILKYGEDIEV